MNAMDRLIQMGCDEAMRAAARYLINDTDAKKIDHVAVSGLLKTHVNGCMDQAMADMREAVEAHMHQVGLATFLASMRIAGIDAAKEYLAAN